MTIKVRVRPPTEEGRLFPRYDGESDILEIESMISRDWPYAVNADAIVMDIDANRVLACVDIEIPRKYWRRGLESAWPRSASAGDLLIADESIAKKEFYELPVRVTSDRDRSEVEIRLGTGVPSRVVGLSDDCVALLRGADLLGFRVRGL